MSNFLTNHVFIKLQKSSVVLFLAMVSMHAHACYLILTVQNEKKKGTVAESQRKADSLFFFGSPFRLYTI